MPRQLRARHSKYLSMSDEDESSLDEESGSGSEEAGAHKSFTRYGGSLRVVTSANPFRSPSH